MKSGQANEGRTIARKLFPSMGRSRQGEHYTLPKHFGYVEIGDPVYLKRWYIFRCKTWSIRIHHIIGPDPDEHPHDHPWDFISIPLRGAYHENVYTLHRWGEKAGSLTNVPRTVRWFSRHRAEDAHKIMRLLRPKGVWTLFITGRERKKWGFITEVGWLPWKTYLGVK